MVALALLVSCQKEEITPIPQEAETIQSAPPCSDYTVNMTMDNTPTLFNVFLNNVAQSSSFVGCPGDTLGMAMTQAFQQDPQNYGQWSVRVTKNGDFLEGCSGNGQAMSYLIILQ